MNTVQRRNAEMVDLLKADFAGRDEPNVAAGNALSTMLLLPELRGLWAFGSVNESGQVLDHSGQGRTLSNTGAVARAAAGLVPYAVFSGANYLSRADEAGLDITGALTFGGWFYATAIGVDQTVLSKWTFTTPQRAYRINILAGGQGNAYVSSDGTALTQVTSTAVLAAQTWYFMAGRFTPSTELAVFLNDEKTTNTVGIPAAIFNSSAAFMIGGVNAAASLTGRAALCFACAAALSDAVVNNLYMQTRAIFGV